MILWNTGKTLPVNVYDIPEDFNLSTTAVWISDHAVYLVNSYVTHDLWKIKKYGINNVLEKC